MENCSGAGALPSTRARVLVVDDHALVREGLRRILEATPPTFDVIEADDAAQALLALRRQPVDVATVDLSMPGVGGLELAQQIRAEFPHVGVLVLSMHAEEQYAMRAFKAGANGYLTKSSAGSELVAAVRKIAAGGLYVTPRLAERALRRLGPGQAAQAHDALSDRELDVLRRLVAGERPKEIARALDLSIKTISAHKARIQDKLQLPSTAALIRYGLEHGLAGDGLPAPPAAAPRQDAAS